MKGITVTIPEIPSAAAKTSAMQPSAIVDDYLRALRMPRAVPTFDYLAEIQRRHLACFTFASVGVWLGDALPLDIDALHRRIVVARRGGYCFEQNGLLCAMLGELGFVTTMCLARVVVNGDEHPALTHRMTLVDIDDRRHVVDVGFGANGPRRPVCLDGEESPECDRTFRISRPRGPELHLQVRRDGDYLSLYKFELARYGAADCEVGHFYSHRHPRAIFVNNLVAARILDDEIRSLRNRDYWLLRAGGDVRRTIDSAVELEAALVDDFGLEVSAEEAARLYARLSPS